MPPDAMPPDAVQPDTLARALAARLLHDLSGPAHGVLSGLELQQDPGDDEALRAEAADLTDSSARALLARLEFCRAAYGEGGEAKTGAALEALARTAFANGRARLAWAPGDVTFKAAAVQAALILAQIAADALASGGVARLNATIAAGWMTLRVEGEGPRSRFHAETLDGLAGRPAGEGLAGRWAPAFLVQALCRRAGGALAIARRPDGFVIEATLPA